MKYDEIRALKELYTGLAVSWAVEELPKPWTQSEAERINEQRLAEQLKVNAFVKYQEARGPSANDLEFEYVWLLIRDDLLREAKALEAMLD